MQALLESRYCIPSTRLNITHPSTRARGSARGSGVERGEWGGQAGWSGARVGPVGAGKQGGAGALPLLQVRRAASRERSEPTSGTEKPHATIVHVRADRDAPRACSGPEHTRCDAKGGPDGLYYPGLATPLETTPSAPADSSPPAFGLRGRDPLGNRACARTGGRFALGPDGPRFFGEPIRAVGRRAGLGANLCVQSGRREHRAGYLPSADSRLANVLYDADRFGAKHSTERI